MKHCYLALGLTLLITACGGSDSSYTLGGSVTGLNTNSEVVLNVNGGSSVTVTANNTPFTFPATFPFNGSYTVTVAAQPTGETCTVNNGIGSGMVANVNNISVTCSENTYTLGGTVSGLDNSEQLTLLNNSDNATITANGTFTFTTPVAYNGNYAVTVSGNPIGETCTVTNGSGAGMVANVSNVAVVCSNNVYSVGGTVTGLASGAQVTLLDNAGDPTTITANGSFTMHTPVAYLGTYAVTVGTQPTGQTCSVSSGSGSVQDRNVSGLAVTCSTNTYPVGGSVSGMNSGQQVTLLNNGDAAHAATVTSNTTFTFPVQVTYGSTYTVTIGTQPADSSLETCSVSNGLGTVSGAVSNLAVNCRLLKWQATTSAGSTTAGSNDGTGSTASFNTPRGVAVDSSGNVYVADSSNNEIRKITSAGVVTTLAGSTTPGSSDGTGSAASFNAPTRIAVDSSGNVYVADQGNHEIRKITPAGVVTTLAGSTTAGSTNGTGSGASFYYPIGIAVDSSGNVYVGDSSNNEIRKITPAGVVTTIAGSTTAGSNNGIGSAASFNSPRGLAIDLSGNLYVADAYNNQIRKITPAGVVTTFAGSTTAGSSDGTGSTATFNLPVDVAIDSNGSLYVADANNNEIRKITPAGVVTTIAGSTIVGSTNGNGAAASFNSPRGLAVDSNGNVYVADTNNNQIRKISP